ncbi:hypothetical protein PR048_032651 [Dryococelus australis]|uniref:Uncharacterized protein n=1 Tax=Dryococelus australis TaxID=614101 RepID=A0ABQ9G2T0_9NEOP|nr:hypothetical protein PR048_032651 [Dryococelus australis]
MPLHSVGCQIEVTTAVFNTYAAITVGEVEAGHVRKHYIFPLSTSATAFTCPLQSEARRNDKRATNPAHDRWRRTVDAEMSTPVAVLQCRANTLDEAVRSIKAIPTRWQLSRSVGTLRDPVSVRRCVRPSSIRWFHTCTTAVAACPSHLVRVELFCTQNLVGHRPRHRLFRRHIGALTSLGSPLGRENEVGTGSLNEVLIGQAERVLTASADTCQKAESKYRNRMRLETASLNQYSDSHKTTYARVKRCRERKINKASERVSVDVVTRNKRPCSEHSHTPGLWNFLTNFAIGNSLKRPSCVSIWQVLMSTRKYQTHTFAHLQNHLKKSLFGTFGEQTNLNCVSGSSHFSSWSTKDGKRVRITPVPRSSLDNPILRHRPARFPLAKIRERPRLESNPFRLDGRANPLRLQGKEIFQGDMHCGREGLGSHGQDLGHYYLPMCTYSYLSLEDTGKKTDIDTVKTQSTE